MTHTTCELMWIKNLMTELGFQVKKLMVMFCDNQAATYIASNPMFHERTKHIEVDCHFIHEVVLKGEVVTPYVMSENQLSDVFTKAVSRDLFVRFCSKLGMTNIYAPA